VKAAGHIKVCENAILPIGAVAVKRANAKKEDDLDDLFGDDDADEESAAAAKKVAKIAKEAAKKKVKKKRIKGSKTNIQEIALSPLEHNQFKIHPQIKTKIPLTTKVITWKLLKNAVSKLIPAKIKYNCAGVQKRLKSIAAIILYENNIIYTSYYFPYSEY
jgi:hypothetical protein